MNFTNGAELLEYCEKEKKTISEAMFERETTFLEQDPEKTKEKMKKAWSIMQASAKKPLKENIVSMGGMIGGAHTPGERKEYLRGCGLKGDRLRSGSSRGQCLHGTYRGGTDRRIFGSDPGSFLFAAGKFRIYG